MDRVPLLVSIEGPLAGNKYTIPAGDEIIIGRSDSCSIRIPDSEVSRQHAMLTLHNAGVWVQDAGSRNGVFINEKRIVRPTELRPGGRLRVGPHAFILELTELEDDDPSIIHPAPVVTPPQPKGMLLIISAVVLVVVGAVIVYFMKQ